jgi:hypothetical protein
MTDQWEPQIDQTRKESVLDYLWSIEPEPATNAQIRKATGILLHQTVYMLTQQLVREGLIHCEMRGREWFFWTDETLRTQSTPPDTAPHESAERLTPRAFEDLARTVMSAYFGIPLVPGEVAGVQKRFDLISSDRKIAGDAKYYTRVGGERPPPAKFSSIAEHVWLLEKTDAPITFLIFGNDREVPVMWLKRYGNLISGVDFYFLTDDGELEHLAGPGRTLATLEEGT